MQVSRDIDLSSFGIHSYGRGEVTVMVPPRPGTRPGGGAAGPGEGGGVAVRRQTLHHSLIIMPDRLITDWPPQSFEELAREHFDLLAEHPMELVLFGSGARLRRPDPRLLSTLMARDIGIEVMDTGAACRTYNILMSDRRRVAAALLMI